VAKVLSRPVRMPEMVRHTRIRSAWVYCECTFGPKDTVLDGSRRLSTLANLDEPSWLLGVRCARYLNDPPPPDWDGLDVGPFEEEEFQDFGI